MALTEQDSPVLHKTRELCETIVSSPDFVTIRKRIDVFMTDDAAKSLYETLMDKGDYLHHKQQQGAMLSAQEIAEYEEQKDKLMKNPVASGFVDAQQQLHKLQESINKFVSKTFELGRLPAAADLEESCGEGCGCH